jgi:hypothetical protein
MYVTSVSQRPSKGGFFKIEPSRGPMKARTILFVTNCYTGAISPDLAEIFRQDDGRSACNTISATNVVLSTDEIKLDDPMAGEA